MKRTEKQQRASHVSGVASDNGATNQSRGEKFLSVGTTHASFTEREYQQISCHTAQPTAQSASDLSGE
jgi:hypothetical protein